MSTYSLIPGFFSSELEDSEESTLEERLAVVISPFHFTSTSVIRNIMKETGAVLSGSCALALVSDIAFDPNDLDFYVPKDGFGILLRFVENFGYKIVQSPVSEYDTGRSLIVRLVHPVSCQTVNVVTGFKRLEHVVHLITKLHSTLVMNFVAHHGIVSLYPYWTMKTQGYTIVDRVETQPCLEEYKRQGFRLENRIAEMAKMSDGHSCGKSPYCPLTMRSLHDEYCYYESFSDIPHHITFYEDPETWVLSENCV